MTLSKTNTQKYGTIEYGGPPSYTLYEVYYCNFLFLPWPPANVYSCDYGCFVCLMAFVCILLLFVLVNFFKYYHEYAPVRSIRITYECLLVKCVSNRKIIYILLFSFYFRSCSVFAICTITLKHSGGYHGEKNH